MEAAKLLMREALMIQGEADSRAELAKSGLKNPATEEMLKRFGAKRLMIEDEAGLRAEPTISGLKNHNLDQTA